MVLVKNSRTRRKKGAIAPIEGNDERAVNGTKGDERDRGRRGGWERAGLHRLLGRSVRPRPSVLFVVLREGKYVGGQFSLSLVESKKNSGGKKPSEEAKRAPAPLCCGGRG